MDMKVNSHKSARVATPPAVGTRGMFRLGDLVPTPANVRKKRDPQTVYDRAVSIAHFGGVLQNLLLVPEMDNDAWTGRLGVAGGETRRLGLCLLRDGGVPGVEGYTDDTLVPGLIVASEDAVAASATENLARTALDPADEFEAFRDVYEQCGSIEAVAAFFAVEPLMVEKRLKLANAAPKLFQLFRDGGMSLEQLMALCLTDDHAQQEKVWKSGEHHTYLRNPSNIRRALIQDRFDFTHDRAARFVGVEAYEAAGGQVVRDLFHPEQAGYANDRELVERLALAKLETLAATVRAEGWPWVDVRTEFTHADETTYTRCELIKRKLSKAQVTEYDELSKALAKTQKKVQQAREAGDLETDEARALRAECDAMQAQLDHLDALRQTVSAVAKPFAGTVVSINHAGGVSVHRGLIQPNDRKEYAKALRDHERAKRASDDGTDDNEGRVTASAVSVAEPAGVSRALSLRLGAQRTAALQLVVAHHIKLALACLADGLVDDVLVGGYHPQVMRIDAKPVRDRLTMTDPSLADARSFKEMEALLDAWRDRVPEEGRLAWLVALPMDEVLQLIAVCTAATINTVGDHAMEASPMDGREAVLAQSAALDMAEWWEPTTDSYLSGVSKDLIFRALQEAGVPQDAFAPLGKLKKGELAARAQVLLAGKRWLPDLLKIPSGQ